MFKRLQAVVSSITAPDDNGIHEIYPKYPYIRPEFLSRSSEELDIAEDHQSRPIIVPSSQAELIFNAGYAEVINAGKTKLNEDQSQIYTFNIGSKKVKEHRHTIQQPHSTSGTSATGDVHLVHVENLSLDDSLSVTYFAVFDGHAGSGAATFAKNVLHLHIKDKFHVLRRHILLGQSSKCGHLDSFTINDSTTCVDVSRDQIITGILESAFRELDDQICRERSTFLIQGGCTALVALFVLGKLYVANAGDSRCVLIKNGEAKALSHDFTPESERARIQDVALSHPEFLGGEFSPLQFTKRLHRRDVGRRTLYRGPNMSGWCYKTVVEGDLRYPLIWGEGKKCRLLATIGVTRGFGDHDLKVFDSPIRVKSFLSCAPEVTVTTIWSDSEDAPSPDDVVVMATDGLWDVCSNDDAATVVREALAHHSVDAQERYTSAAQELVMYSRGVHYFPENGEYPANTMLWRQRSGNMASGDDISVLVIPILPHYLQCSAVQSADSDHTVSEPSSGACGNSPNVTYLSELPTDQTT